jgi:hypothetical protein
MHRPETLAELIPHHGQGAVPFAGQTAAMHKQPARLADRNIMIVNV